MEQEWIGYIWAKLWNFAVSEGCLPIKCQFFMWNPKRWMALKKVEIFPFFYSPNGKCPDFCRNNPQAQPLPHSCYLLISADSLVHFVMSNSFKISPNCSPNVRHQLIWLGSCGSDIGITVWTTNKIRHVQHVPITFLGLVMLSHRVWLKLGSAGIPQTSWF